ncbi:MAG: DUF1499 domain-containing protein [Alphaproteobacteria bacterium]|nr:DUF1499 domain-containing protein [Alphaproteobacteria bacterium]
MRSQHIAAIVSLVSFLIGGAIVGVAMWGTMQGWWRYPRGLEIALPGFAIGAVGAAAGLLWTARALRNNNSYGWKFGALGVVGCLFLIGLPLNQLRLYLTAPPIHDISTDPEYPPPFKAVLPLRVGALNGPEYDGPNPITWQGKRMTVSAAQKKAYLEIRPQSLLFPNAAATGRTPKGILFWHAFFRMQAMGLNIVSFDEQSGIIEATASSIWFGLTSDVSVRVKAAGRSGAQADIRAKSRDVENDMGFNASLVKSIRSAIQ